MQFCKWLTGRKNARKESVTERKIANSSINCNNFHDLFIGASVLGRECSYGVASIEICNVQFMQF